MTKGLRQREVNCQKILDKIATLATKTEHELKIKLTLPPGPKNRPPNTRQQKPTARKRKKLGNSIRKALETKSLRDLSQEARIPIFFLRRFKEGRIYPNPTQLIRLNNALRVTTDTDNAQEQLTTPPPKN